MAIERSRQFKGYTLEHIPSGVVARKGDTEVGRLDVHDGVIQNVRVDPKHQEKGVATAMLKFGRERQPIAHDQESNMTASGYQWAKVNP